VGVDIKKSYKNTILAPFLRFLLYLYIKERDRKIQLHQNYTKSRNLQKKNLQKKNFFYKKEDNSKKR
jgi:hypothetical protein